MDSHTLELLEWNRIRELIAGYAACSLGKERARALLPSIDPAEIHSRLVLATEMTEAVIAGLSPSFGGLKDIRAEVRRAATGAALEPEELAATANVIEAVAEMDRWLGRVGDEFPRLGALRSDLGVFSGVGNAIRSCLDERARVLDSASSRLAAIRREVHQAEERIQETLKRMLRSPEIRRILRFPNFTMVGEHYVLPVAKDHRGEIQGSVQRTSASNETVFIEPQAIAEQSAQLSYLRSKEHKEVRRILRWLSAQVGQVAAPLLLSIETLGHLDYIHAKARYSLDFHMAPPELNQDGRVVLRNARHPLLESLFRVPPEAPDSAEPTPRREVVPIDVHLGIKANLLIVTGPNTGGKTVALKTVALLAIMAQAGLHIPASPGSQLPIFDQVLADIGDEQSLEQSLSTFSSHIKRISEIFNSATGQSLVVLDEMGAGTDPAEGAALGRAILDELDAIGCRAIVTTHLGDLKTYAFTNPRAENAAVEFDEESLRPLYRLRIGDIGQSNALRIARRLKLPERLVAAAEVHLREAQGRGAPDWEILQRLRQEAESARQSAIASQLEADRVREALAQRLADLQRQTERDARIEEARSRLAAGDRVVVPRLGYDRPGRVVKVDARKQTATVAIGSMKWDVAIAELVPQLIKEAGPDDRNRADAPRSRSRLEDFGDDL